MKLLYKVTDSIREELKKPLGSIICEDEVLRLKYKRLVVVGDESAYTFYKYNIIPNLTVVDFKVSRKYTHFFKKNISAVNTKIVNVVNPQGYITFELWQSIEKYINGDEKVRIEVEGEEDLSALVCIYLAEQNTTVIYGLLGIGLHLINVDLQKKHIVKQILDRMRL